MQDVVYPYTDIYKKAIMAFLFINSNGATSPSTPSERVDGSIGF